MPYTVEFLKTAVEELEGLPTNAQRQIVKKIDGLKNDPKPAGVILRLRVGDYRVIYLVEGKQLVILVVKIGDRKDVYDDLKVLANRAKVRRQARKK